MEHYKINNSDIFLDDKGSGCGKITISDSYGYNFSYYWGSMGCHLKEFLLSIDHNYFTSCLLGRGKYSYDKNKTLKNIRDYIRIEMGLKWYDHMGFQKDMRKKLNEHSKYWDSDNSFVHGWNSFINSLDYSLIENRFEREYIENDFKGIGEQWYFIGESESGNSKYLKDLFNRLQKLLKSNMMEH